MTALINGCVTSRLGETAAKGYKGGQELREIQQIELERLGVLDGNSKER